MGSLTSLLELIQSDEHISKGQWCDKAVLTGPARLLSLPRKSQKFWPKLEEAERRVSVYHPNPRYIAPRQKHSGNFLALSTVSAVSDV